VGEPAFADIKFYAGVAETDWSWTPSIADLIMMVTGILLLQMVTPEM